MTGPLGHWCLATIAIAVVGLTQAAPPTAAQASVAVATVLAAYVPAAGAQTRGLPWETGRELPVAWETAAPVAAADYDVQQGFTLKRRGTLVVEVGSETRDATLELLGNEGGIQQTMLAWPQLSGPFEAAAQALVAAGVTLTPLKCRRETEPASYGHVVHVAAFPGKLAAALWENWNCAHDGCGYSLTWLYRRTAVDRVECAGGGA